MMSLEDIHRVLPNDHARPIDIERHLWTLKWAAFTALLDVGAGDGRSYDIAEQNFSEFRWIGLNIAISQEVRSRSRVDCELDFLDGVKIRSGCKESDVLLNSSALMAGFENRCINQLKVTYSDQFSETGRTFVALSYQKDRRPVEMRRTRRQKFRVFSYHSKKMAEFAWSVTRIRGIK